MTTTDKQYALTVDMTLEEGEDLATVCDGMVAGNKARWKAEDVKFNGYPVVTFTGSENDLAEVRLRYNGWDFTQALYHHRDFPLEPK